MSIDGQMVPLLLAIDCILTVSMLCCSCRRRLHAPRRPRYGSTSRSVAFICGPVTLGNLAHKYILLQQRCNPHKPKHGCIEERLASQANGCFFGWLESFLGHR